MSGECICVLRFRGKARDFETCSISELLDETDTSLVRFYNMWVFTDVSVIDLISDFHKYSAAVVRSCINFKQLFL